jgi:non-ribosomal peptide synthetase component E (peptide arylation enzyme)
MQYRKFLHPTLLLLFLLSACCIGTRECLPPYSGYAGLRIVSASDGRDLVFGQNSVYDRSKIAFYTLSGSDTTLFEFKAEKANSAEHDSVLIVNFFPAAETAYMRLSNGDIDTLKLAFRTHKKTSCCNASSELNTITYNNAYELNVRNGAQEVKK